MKFKKLKQTELTKLKKINHADTFEYLIVNNDMTKENKYRYFAAQFLPSIQSYIIIPFNAGRNGSFAISLSTAIANTDDTFPNERNLMKDFLDDYDIAFESHLLLYRLQTLINEKKIQRTDMKKANLFYDLKEKLTKEKNYDIKQKLIQELQLIRQQYFTKEDFKTIADVKQHVNILKEKYGG